MERRNRQEQQRALKRARKANVLIDEEQISISTKDGEDKGVVVFKDDGFNHCQCPVTQFLDPELNAIFEDTFYCIETNSLPNGGNAMDQSQVFKVAFLALKMERELIKAEKEKAAADKAVSKSKSSAAASGRGKGRGRSRH